jgi:hypothetical protein
MLEAPRVATKAKETKEVGLGLDDASKTAKIGDNLDPNRKSRSSTSYVSMHMCLHGNLYTCLGYHES